MTSQHLKYTVLYKIINIVSYYQVVAHHTQPSLLRTVVVVVKVPKVVVVVDTTIQVSRVKNDQDVVRRSIIHHRMMVRGIHHHMVREMMVWRLAERPAVSYIADHLR